MQVWWRGIREARLVRSEMKSVFQQDVRGTKGLRCLVLIGRDEGLLEMWSTVMADGGIGEQCPLIMLPTTGSMWLG